MSLKDNRFSKKASGPLCCRSISLNLGWAETNPLRLSYLCLLVTPSEHSVPAPLRIPGAWNPPWLWLSSLWYLGFIAELLCF